MNIAFHASDGVNKISFSVEMSVRMSCLRFPCNRNIKHIERTNNYLTVSHESNDVCLIIVNFFGLVDLEVYSRR